MKTAISIDDKVFQDAEFAAKALGMSRSSLYSAAVKEFIEHHLPENITENYNSVFSRNTNDDEELMKISMESLSQVEWDD